MINLDEYLRFRLLEHKMRGYVPQKQTYQGVRLYTKADQVEEKFCYFFHELFGTIVLYSRYNVGKTPVCEAIDEEIRKEYQNAMGLNNPHSNSNRDSLLVSPAVKTNKEIPRNLSTRLRGVWFGHGL